MGLASSLLGSLDPYVDHYANSSAKSDAKFERFPSIYKGSISIGSGSGSAGAVDLDRLSWADYKRKAYEYNRQAQAQGIPLLEEGYSRAEVKNPISFNQQLLLLEDV